jgi:class 3 adenylate cyclase
MERKLAAILASDVVGYSRLMEQDESETLSMLKARRMEILEPLVAQHRGRIFKFTGDGVLIEFGSAVNAVQCAIDLHDIHLVFRCPRRGQSISPIGPRPKSYRKSFGSPLYAILHIG